ncbi:hypothetical protein H5410_063000 [Solanum commersonii]|uniref:Uncharacterized protein n=1 Tax=Solanum commersonii TaxID=4109 RepID=A0A9J5WCB3_SOLCO|nr:hypothetical protein H5410_063000 [Solanum commersonii]
MEDDDEYSAHETSVGVSESKESPQKKVRQLKIICAWRYFKKIGRDKMEWKKQYVEVVRNHIGLVLLRPNDEDELLKETISHADSNVIDGTSGSGVVKL